MADPAQPIAEIRKLLNAARSASVNFAVCLGRQPADLVLLVDRSKTPRALASLAKARGETTKVFFGDLNVDGNRAVFITASDPPSGALPQLRKFFELHRLAFKPEFGTPLAQDIRDGAERTATMGAADDMSPELKLWRKADAEIEAAARAWLATGEKLPARALAAWKELRKWADRGDPRRATRAAPKVLAMLAPPGSAQEGGGGDGALAEVRARAADLRGRMSPQQEKLLKAAAAQAKAGNAEAARQLLARLGPAATGS